MAEIEIAPLTDRLNDDEIADLAGGLANLGAPRLPRPGDESSLTLGDGIDDDVLTEFLDRLDAHDVACEIYLPLEFEGRVEVADLRVGSTTALLEALEEMKDDLAIDADEEEDEETASFEEEDDLLAAKLRHIWKLLYDGAHVAIDRRLPLHMKS